MLESLVILSYLFKHPLGNVHQKHKMTLSSPSFLSHGAIPDQNLCQTLPQVAPLHWRYVPKKTQTLALIIDNENAPRSERFKLGIFNLDAHLKGLKTMPTGANKIQNRPEEARKAIFCKTQTSQHLRFRLFALDKRVFPKQIKRISDLERSMRGHIIHSAHLLAYIQKR